MNVNFEIKENNKKKIYNYIGIVGLILLVFFIIEILKPEMLFSANPFILILLGIGSAIGIIYSCNLFVKYNEIAWKILTSKDERTVKIRNSAFFHAAIITAVLVFILHGIIHKFIIEIPLNLFVPIAGYTFAISTIIIYYFLNKKGDV